MAHKPSKAEAAEGPPDEEVDVQEELIRHARKPLSVPAKASCLTFVVLVMLVVSVLVWFRWTGRNMDFGPWYYLAITACVITIPIVLYRAVTLWMFDESARYPDIAYAWNAGIAELALHGMSLDSAPLFFIIGTGSERMRRSFMAASGAEFFMDGVCESGSPLYWYANSDGIFVYLNDVCWANAAISLYEVNADSRRRVLPGDQPRGGAGPQKIVRAMGTLVPDLRGPSVSPPPRRPEMPSDHDATTAGNEHGADVRVSPRQEMSSDAYMGTLTPGQVMGSSGGSRPSPPPATSRSPVASSSRVINRLSSQQSTQQLQRLEHFCSVFLAGAVIQCAR